MMKALIIDDDPGICMLIEQILKFRKIESANVSTIDEAREMLGNMSPDMIFIDHRLPDGPGIDFIPEIRQIHPGTIVVAMTAEYEAERNINIFGKGADHFLEKPFYIDDVNKLLDSRML
jgi:DNA-binding NtrC family response regulator